MAKKKTKTQLKKGADKRDNSLKIEGTLDDVLKASVPSSKKPNLDVKDSFYFKVNKSDFVLFEERINKAFDSDKSIESVERLDKGTHFSFLIKFKSKNQSFVEHLNKHGIYFSASAGL